MLTEEIPLVRILFYFSLNHTLILQWKRRRDIEGYVILTSHFMLMVKYHNFLRISNKY